MEESIINVGGRFVMQFGLVVAAAAAFWISIFLWLSRHSFSADNRRSWEALALLSLPLFFFGLALFLPLWWLNALVVFPDLSLAHEGLVKPLISQAAAGFAANLPWVSLETVLAAVAVLIYFRRRELFISWRRLFFTGQFVILSLILSLAAFSGRLDFNQLSQSLHQWHSLLTLGTVISVDYLYLTTRGLPWLKPALYRFFPLMSLAIWLGLGLDFLASFLVFEGIFPGTAQFYFNQLVVAVIIINGALLSIKLNDYLLSLLTSAGVLEPTGRMALAMRLSGSVSLASWTAITFLDFIAAPAAGLMTFLIPYLILVALLYWLKPQAEKLGGLFRQLSGLSQSAI